MAIESVQHGWRIVDQYAIEAFNYTADLIHRVASVVWEFFSKLAEAIWNFCDGCDLFQNVFVSNEDPVLNNESLSFQLGEFPVDLPALSAVLRRGCGQALISSRMTAIDFAALCEPYPITVRIRKNGQVIRNAQIQEIFERHAILNAEKERVRREEGEEAARALIAEFDFPPQRITIGEWAKEWAKQRTLRIDPAHPYFDIFEEAFRLREQIYAGNSQVADYTTYSVSDELYSQDPHFLYIIKSLMGFQELSREGNRALIRKLDNETPTFNSNPAYQFARSLSKIFCYPTYALGEMNIIDLRDKLEIGMGAPMAAFRAAQQRGKVLKFFTQSFGSQIGHPNCFDARVDAFQQFRFDLENPQIVDFSPNLQNANTTNEKIWEYFRIFKNKAAFNLANALNPENPHFLYQQIKNGILNQHLLFTNYCTRDKFEQFLIQEGNPVRELQRAIDPRIPQIPFQRNWNGWIPIGFKQFPLNEIPLESRTVNSIVGVQDPNFFIATLQVIYYQQNNNQYYLVFSKNRPRPYQMNHPVLPYNQIWMGRDRDLIDPNTLPDNRRFNGATLLIRDPATYTARVHAIQGNTAVLEFQGNPVPRARWEAFLTDEYWTTQT